MISLVEFLNSKSSLDKQYEEELIPILDKIDVGNVELLSNEEFQSVLVKLMSSALSNKTSDETIVKTDFDLALVIPQEAIIDKLDEIDNSTTLFKISKQ